MKKLIVLAILLALVGCAVPVRETPVKHWAPYGFTQWDDKTAYRRLPNDSITCSYGKKYIGYEIMARYGCQSLYVEVAFYNSSGVQIDWTNETAKGLSAGGKAQLIFNSYEDQAKKGEIVKISCHQ